MNVNEVEKALQTAARALEICSDWGCHEVQCEPPKEWSLDSIAEDKNDGWCSTYELALKLREMSENL